MRSVGCGLLLFCLLLSSALGQGSDAQPRPSLGQAGGAPECDSTPWAKAIADIKAADPEEDAPRQIAEGKFSLRAEVEVRSGIDIQLRPVEIQTKDGRTLRGLNPGVVSDPMPIEPPAKDATVAAPDSASKPREPKRSDVSRTLSVGGRSPGVSCLLNVPSVQAFRLFPYWYPEDASGTDLSERCIRAALVLANEYAGRFNGRVVSDPAYPHKDVCAVERPGAMDRRITDQPTPDQMPAEIQNAATAARFGLSDRVARFIADGADLRWRDELGFDALMWAVVRDYREVLDLIITSGGSSDFCAALEVAVKHDRAAIVAPLAERCTSPERRLELLEPAVAEGGSVETLQSLLEAGFPQSLVESVKVREVLWAAISADRVDVMHLMLGWMAPRLEHAGQRWNEMQRGLLGMALAVRSFGVAELLLDRGVDPGPRALHRAVERREERVLEMLVRHGVDLNASHPQETSAPAAPEASLDPLGRRPPPPSIPGDERTRGNADPPIFLALAPLMDVKMFTLLLELGADPNVRDHTGRTLLMVAIADSQIYGRKDGIGWIERYVPQRLIEGQEDWAHRGVEPVLALLAKGADVGLADKDGLTALHHAARSDYAVEIVQILLEHGADINARDAAGRTPLDHARAAKLVRMPGVLVTAGARSGSP